MVRSRIAHGIIRSIDTGDARALPGVLGVYTAADLEGYGAIKPGIMVPMNATARRCGRRRGRRCRPSACASSARRSLSSSPRRRRKRRTRPRRSLLDIEALPAVTTPDAAAAPDAPLLHAEAPGNVALDYHYRRHRGGRRRFRQRRACDAARPSPAIASSSTRSSRARRWPNTTPKSQRFTLHVGCQGVFGMRRFAEGRARRRSGASAGADRQCRRLLRHEGVGLPRVCLPAACGARAGPAGASGRTSAPRASSPTITAATTR